MSKETEAILAKALEKDLERRMSSYPSDDELPEHEFSPRFKKKMNRLIKAQRRFYYPMISTAAGKAAAIVIICLLAAFGVTMGTSALRTPVLGFVVKTYETISELFFDIGDTEPLKEIAEYLAPQYLPQGYSFCSERKENNYYRVTYLNEAGHELEYGQNLRGLRMSINTEGVEYETVHVKDYAGIFCRNLGVDMLIWDDGIYVYSIFTEEEIGTSELLKMAGSLVVCDG